MVTSTLALGMGCPVVAFNTAMRTLYPGCSCITAVTLVTNNSERCTATSLLLGINSNMYAPTGKPSNCTESFENWYTLLPTNLHSLVAEGTACIVFLSLCNTCGLFISPSKRPFMFSRHTFMVMLERLRTLEKCTFRGFFGKISRLEATSNVGLDTVF